MFRCWNTDFRYLPSRAPAAFMRSSTSHASFKLELADDPRCLNMLVKATTPSVTFMSEVSPAALLRFE